KLLRAGDDEKGLAKYINRGFDRVRSGYSRILAGTMRARPAMYVLWGGLTLLAVVFFMMSPKELAPTEDQGVIFGIVDTPASTTVEALMPSIEKINEHYFE